MSAKSAISGDLEAKFKAFGWEVARCDGHDLYALRKILSGFKAVTDKPKILIADTVKGKGVSKMCRVSETEFGPMYKYHSGAPSDEDYTLALEEISGRVNAMLEKHGLDPLELVSEDRPVKSAPEAPEKTGGRIRRRTAGSWRHPSGAVGFRRGPCAGLRLAAFSQDLSPNVLWNAALPNRIWFRPQAEPHGWGCCR